MQKIPSLFCRNYDGDRLVRDEVVPGCEWVEDGEGVATIKFDGTCCMARGGKLFKRYELKKGKKPPANFEPATECDEKTGKTQGWVPVGDGPEDKWFRSALSNWVSESPIDDGTYELCGPKIQGNPDGFSEHTLVRHGVNIAEDCPFDFDGLKEYLSTAGIEGIVWDHPDGRMCKIKTKDFGLKRV